VNVVLKVYREKLVQKAQQVNRVPQVSRAQLDQLANRV
jgi:hypothetical protein